MQHNDETMIEKLRYLNRNTVWGFFFRLSHNSDVCVRRIDGFVKCLKDMPTFLYVSKGEAIVLGLNPIKDPYEELADEKPPHGDTPQYYTETAKRTSPVFLLSQVMSNIGQSLVYTKYRVPKLKGVLLTNSIIINKSDMTEVWKERNVMVFDEIPFTILIPSTADSGKAPMWFNKFRNYCQAPGFTLAYSEEVNDDDGEEEQTYDDAEIERLMKEFVIGLGDNSDDNSDDDESDDDESNVDEDDADNDDETESTIVVNGHHLPMIGSMAEKDKAAKVEVYNPVTDPKGELGRLVGCKDVKLQIDSLLDMTHYNTLLHEKNPAGRQHKVSLHGIFFGRPGTGKTTLCKIYGSLLHEAGMLSKGHVVCCNRSTFIGNNWGDEENAVRAVLEMAMGGVLMIDEAYLLNSSHPSDPGKMVIPLLMDILANEEMRDLAIILCGYKDEMLHLISLNPGLVSRFPNQFEFPDFSVDDLMEITRRRIKDYGYHFTRSSWQKYKDIVVKAYDGRDSKTWGNARFVANLLEHIYLRHARRCIRMKDPDKRHLLTITTADIEPIQTPMAKGRIGF